MRASLSFGFTLLELAIALTIIGLVAGGIIGGSNMIRSAEVQSVGGDFQEFEAAVQNFKDHYRALPGDFASATLQWGGDTEDGSDDGIINDPVIDEFLRAWQHLSLAEMVDGDYTGVPGPAGFILAGVNVPKGQIASGGFLFNQLADEMLGGAPNGTSLTFIRALDTAITNVPVLTPTEAFMIDRKFDDGKPGSGKIKAPGNGGTYTVCATTNDPATAEYNGTSEAIACIINFRMHLE